MNTLLEQESLGVALSVGAMSDEQIRAELAECHASGMVAVIQEVTDFLATHPLESKAAPAPAI